MTIYIYINDTLHDIDIIKSTSTNNFKIKMWSDREIENKSIDTNKSLTHNIKIKFVFPLLLAQ